ncbi:MAG: aminotransferase class I/II-fold pyridoxal phosphate-dependent enzyme, partial [Clostridia bacterium]|nr:aminotransferase class I/II-fold pyridoxal phosphate-dependent enzyme [Clostridia bacterium]
VLRGTDIMVLSDEIYSELTYHDEGPTSFAAIDGMKERTLLVSGFSKSYAMTGWRLGYVCGPAPVMKEIIKLHQYGIMCAPTTAQYAAIEALDNGDDDVVQMRNDYDQRRRLIVNELNAMGLTCFDPQGAFYVFPSIEMTGMTSEEFCTELLMTKHVAVVPGTAFGDCGEGFVRISYCYSIKHIIEALRRMREFLVERGFLTEEA